jgi:DNA-directed RNA polymerase subunit RPC12/RpoP
MDLYIKCPRCKNPCLDNTPKGSKTYSCKDCGLKIRVDDKNKKIIILSTY